MHGIDLMRAAADIQLGRSPELPVPERWRTGGWLLVPSPGPRPRAACSATSCPTRVDPAAGGTWPPPRRPRRRPGHPAGRRLRARRRPVRCGGSSGPGGKGGSCARRPSAPHGASSRTSRRGPPGMRFGLTGASAGGATAAVLVLEDGRVFRGRPHGALGRSLARPCSPPV
ncbi:hypothetical protein LT493_20600 [Streptomyces tricolor]|nr:hypothetical protein [Streptomyces tricolor]